MRAAALRDRLDGDLVLPDETGFALARQLQNTEYDTIEPSAVAYCASERDVALCVRHAREQGVRLHVRGGGHSFNGWSTGEGLVVDLSRMNHAVAEGPVVRLGAGGHYRAAGGPPRAPGGPCGTRTVTTGARGGGVSG
ncbi:FAD-binding oxidoreductase, partial [Streptomyces collinus]